MIEMVSDCFCFCIDSVIGNEETLESFELHICVKDYCFARDDRLVGVAVMQLKDIVEQVGRLFSSLKNDRLLFNYDDSFNPDWFDDDDQFRVLAPVG